MYVYIKSESSLWTVGFYNPDGKWESESDHAEKENAANRAAWLNGNARVNNFDAVVDALKKILEWPDMFKVKSYFEINKLVCRFCSKEIGHAKDCLIYKAKQALDAVNASSK